MHTRVQRVAFCVSALSLATACGTSSSGSVTDVDSGTGESSPQGGLADTGVATGNVDGSRAPDGASTFDASSTDGGSGDAASFADSASLEAGDSDATTPEAGASDATTLGDAGADAAGPSDASTEATTSVDAAKSEAGGPDATTPPDSGTGAALTPQQVVKVMPPGWNLGNSFDGDPTVTSFGNPAPNQTLIDAVHAAGFNTLRLPVTWTDHIGAAPTYTIDSTWMAQVEQTAQWAVDAGMYVFVNTHHDADGQWVTFPETAAAAATVAGEVTAVWTQIATAFASFNRHLMFECFNEPHNASGNDAMTQTDLNTYLEACVTAVRGTGGANATRIIMIQPVGASPVQAGIQSMQKATIINDPNLLISLHTYYPTNFGLSETPYAWGSAADYTSMQDSISQQIRVWLPTQPVVIGEWGSEGAQATANRAAHALAYSQDVTTAGMVPVWWDNGGTGKGSYAIFNRTTGAQTYPTIISGIMTGVKYGQAAPNTWATLTNP
jgi:endoglucanase